MLPATLEERCRVWLKLALILSVAWGLWRVHTSRTGDRLVAPATLDHAQIARHLSRGRGYVTSFLRPLGLPATASLSPQPDDFAPPLPSYLLAAAFVLGGSSEQTVLWASICCYLALLCLIFSVGRALFDRTVAFLAVAFAAVHGGLLQLALVHFPHLVAAVLGTALVGVWDPVFYEAQAEEEGAEEEVKRRAVPWLPARPFFLAGCLWGLICLSETFLILLLPLAALFAGLARGRGGWKAGAAFGLGWVLVMGPWGLRNTLVTGRPWGVLPWYQVLAATESYPGYSVYRQSAAPSPLEFLLHHPEEIAQKAVAGLRQAAAMWSHTAGGWVSALFLVSCLDVQGWRRVGWLRMWLLGGLLGHLGIVCLTDHDVGRLAIWSPGLILVAAAYLWERVTPPQGEEWNGRCGPWTLQLRSAAVRDGLIAVCLVPSLAMRVAEAGLERPTTPPGGQGVQDLSRWPASGAIVTDVPWAVAWLADRTAVWLPRPEAEAPDPSGQTAQVSAIYLSPLILQYDAREQVRPWQRMALGRSRPEGFRLAQRWSDGSVLFVRERNGN